MSAPYAEVIGDPIAHSKSPIIHNFWLDAFGMPGIYRKTHVTGPDLAAFLGARRTDPDWRGCNVTVPHKQAVIPHLDRLDPAAAAIGAVNTIVREGDALVGYNTDAAGFLEPLQPLLAERHLFRMVRILGAGGAARGVAYALRQHGFVTVIVARDTAKAAALFDASVPPEDRHVASLASFAEPIDFAWDDRAGVLDLVVNTTSLGMVGQPPLAIDFSHVPPGAIVYDIVYAPLKTPLLIEAKRRGHPTIDGLAMLIGQARHAFAHFFHGAVPPTDRDPILREMLTA